MSTLLSSVSAGILALDPAIWRDKILSYATAVIEKRRIDAEARAIDSIVKAGRAELLAAMGASPAATCDTLVLTSKTTKAAAATITLADGRVIPWERVTGLTIGNEYIGACDVMKIYGGRDGSTGVEVAGT